MVKKVSIVVLLGLVAFIGWVSTRDGHFRYERSAVINAPVEKIFPYLSNFRKGELWNPYSKKDPNLKRTFLGPGDQVGSVMEFDGNNEVGTGKLEFLKIVPNQIVEIKLTMLKPFSAENLVQYQLIPEGAVTRFVWSMSGDGGFMGKLVSLLMDCEKMVTNDFTQGINNLKTIVESQSQS